MAWCAKRDVGMTDTTGTITADEIPPQGCRTTTSRRGGETPRVETRETMTTVNLSIAHHETANGEETRDEFSIEVPPEHTIGALSYAISRAIRMIGRDERRRWAGRPFGTTVEAAGERLRLVHVYSTGNPAKLLSSGRPLRVSF